jgi:hypothetical protein
MVKLTVMGRDAPLDVAALPDQCPVLIGYVPLEQLDLVVDPTGQRLIGDLTGGTPRGTPMGVVFWNTSTSFRVLQGLPRGPVSGRPKRR